MVESFQEVELGLPQFSDITLSGEDMEAGRSSSTSLKSVAGEEQTQMKTAAADKAVSSIKSTV